MACFKLTKWVALAVIAFVIAGGRTTLRAQADKFDQQAISIVDQRDPEESKKHTLSQWIGSCDYFVIRLDDAGMAKNRISQLSDDLSHSLKQPLVDTIYVKHYTLYLNSGIQMVDSAFAAGAASIGSVAIASARKVGVAKCSRDKMKGGWFDSSEVLNDQLSVVRTFGTSGGVN